MLEIYIIRHCDKPEPIEGDLCSAQGYQRAMMLPAFWNVVLSGRRPNAIYAANFSPNDKKCSASRRLVLIMLPTASFYGLCVDAPYCYKEYEKLAHHVLSKHASGIVLIGYEHHTIPHLAESFGIHPRPGKWPGDRFDLVFKITIEKGKKTELSIFTEGLGLLGDSFDLPLDYQKYSKKELFTANYNDQIFLIILAILTVIGLLTLV